MSKYVKVHYKDVLVHTLGKGGGGRGICLVQFYIVDLKTSDIPRVMISSIKALGHFLLKNYYTDQTV